VRAAANEIEPNAEIRVELIDAAESSLRLNTILDWVEAQLARVDEGAGKYWRIKKLAIGLAIFLPTVGYPTYDFYFGDPPTVSLSDEDRKLLNELLEHTRSAPGVEEKRRAFFRTVERDPSISSVRVAEGRSEPSAILVPSEEFAERGGLWALQEEEQERTLYPVLDVTLVAPRLVARPRSWVFQQEGMPEFSATMRDRTFLAALAQDHVRERLRIGIPMTIRLEVSQQEVDHYTDERTDDKGANNDKLTHSPTPSVPCGVRWAVTAQLAVWLPLPAACPSASAPRLGLSPDPWRPCSLSAPP
jgi:hypothetical protein